MSVARIAACSDVALLKVVVRAPPFQSTTEAGMKFVPVTVRTNAGPPAVAVAGEIEVIVGVGGGDGEITKFTGEDVPAALPELVTVTEAVPALATSADIICACSAFALTNMVVRDLPFQFTVELEV
jgi:hypothetical protein